ncbi:MAG: WhiB family transcriptional regulator [Streptosporangiaceae bacterium]|nr:WhiB family transcriptional regulator [Streptosporangiaceae bacterium]
MTETGSSGNWRMMGACLSADPDLFFPISAAGPALRQTEQAKAICSGCRVRQECLQFALSHDQLYGIWGGTTPDDRQRYRRRQRRRAAAAAAAAATAAPARPAPPRKRAVTV